MRGFFITVEGIEGAGKTTAIACISQYLQSAGWPEIIKVREPGGTPLCEDIRALVKRPRDERVCPETELLLMYASRAQLVHTVIEPALAGGACVVADRHDLSTIAYQGGGRGLSLDLIAKVRAAAIGSFKPDLTLLMDIDPKIGLARIKTRGAADRIEQEHLDFFTRTRQAYLDCAAKDPSIALIDAAQPLAQVQQQIIKVLQNKVPAWK